MTDRTLRFVVGNSGSQKIRLDFDWAGLTRLREELEALWADGTSRSRPAELLAPSFHLTLKGKAVIVQRRMELNTRIRNFVLENPGINRGKIMQRFKLRAADMEFVKVEMEGDLRSHIQTNRQGMKVERFWSTPKTHEEEEEKILSVFTIEPPELEDQFNITPQSQIQISRIVGTHRRILIKETGVLQTIEMSIQGLGTLQVYLEGYDFETYAEATGRSFMKIFGVEEAKRSEEGTETKEKE